MARPKKKRSKPLQEEGSQDPALDELIRFANLLPLGKPLPPFPDRAIELDEDWWTDDGLQRQFPRFLDEHFPRDKFSEFRAFMDDQSRKPTRPHAMYSYLQEVRGSLRMIATTQQRKQSIFESDLRFPWHLIGQWRVDRIRVCENCGILFFANRNNRTSHSDACANARRVRKFRERQPQYEQARKKKSASLTVEQSQKRMNKRIKNVPEKTR